MKIRIIIPVLIFFIGLVIWKLSTNKKMMEDKLEQSMIVNTTIPVITERPRFSRLNNDIILNGTIIPDKEVFILSKAEGISIHKYKKTGDRVQKGDAIIQIENTVLKKSLTIAQADYAKILKDIRRYQSLQTQGAVSQQELENSQMSLREIEKHITSLKDQIENTTIVSPSSGIISKTFVEEGQLVIAGGEVAHIISGSGLKLQVNATEEDVLNIRKNQNVKIQIPSLENESFSGIVDIISPKANNLHFYTIDIKLEGIDESLKPGMYANVKIQPLEKEAQQIIISRKAIVGGLKRPYVFIVKNGKAYKRNVQSGFYNDKEIEIKSGVSIDDVVVNSGQINLTDGMPVSILNKQN